MLLQRRKHGQKLKLTCNATQKSVTILVQIRGSKVDLLFDDQERNFTIKRLETIQGEEDAKLHDS